MGVALAAALTPVASQIACDGGNHQVTFSSSFSSDFHCETAVKPFISRFSFLFGHFLCATARVVGMTRFSAGHDRVYGRHPLPVTL
jgi:hypothetical protein